MGVYLLKRLLLVIPTLFGVLTVVFFIAQVTPGGPVDRALAQITGTDVSSTARIGGGTGDGIGGAPRSGQPGQGTDSVGGNFRNYAGVNKELIEKLQKTFGYDKPWYVRYWILLRDYSRFQFGESFSQSRQVIDIIKEKLPVSISLGLWIMLITYAVSIPLGIRKAMRDGEQFDTWTSSVLVIGYAIPGFIFAVLLIVLFAGASFFQWFPLRGLHSEQWSTFLKPYGSFTGFFACGIRPACAIDYFWHLALPLTAMIVGSFTTMAFLTKNSFLDEIRKQYVITARAKGLSERRVLYGHVFRNAMLIIIAGFPSAFVSSFFSGSLLIETIFSLDGLGLLGFNSLINRDYPVVFATVYIFALMGMVLHIISDFIYTLVDPRIDFESREV